MKIPRWSVYLLLMAASFMSTKSKNNKKHVDWYCLCSDYETKILADTHLKLPFIQWVRAIVMELDKDRRLFFKNAYN